MRCSSLVLRPEPRCEIVERDAQSRGNLGERGGEGVAAEAAMGAPSADRVLAGAEASDQLDRQIVGACLLLTERGLARLGGGGGQILGVLEALDQRLVFGAAERDGLALLAYLYASLRCATVSRTIVSAVRSTRQFRANHPGAGGSRPAARAAVRPPDAPQMVPRRKPPPYRATPRAPALVSLREPSTRPV
jgi:hypothetical protein